MNMGEPLEEIFINKQTKDEKMKIRHTIYLTNGETETKDYDNAITSQEGFVKNIKRNDVVDIDIKIIREEKWTQDQEKPTQKM